MGQRRKLLISALALIAPLAAVCAIQFRQILAPDPRTIHAALTDAEGALAQAGLAKGLPAYIRIFKEGSELEFWMQDQGSWRLFDSFPICAWSGALGPKLREGDRQSPEGFYRVTRDSLNPNSSYHLSFNLGFPNAYDRAHGRTGSFLMVHGNCVSIGCYAMTDPGIEVIYRLVEAALAGGQDAVPVHIFPFRMTDQKMAQMAASPWAGFWQELKPAFDYFEETRRVPRVGVAGKSYSVSLVNASFQGARTGHGE